MTLRKSRLRLTQAIFFGEPAQAGGLGTVTSVTGGNGIVATPSPIVGVGNVDLGPLTADWTASVVAAGSTPKAITAKNTTGWFNVVAYGADPTGAIDSVVAVQKAINDASTVGGTIYFPAGTYKCTSGTLTVSALQGSMIFRGDGSKATFISLPNAVDGFSITNVYPNQASVCFYDMMLFASAATAGAFIHSNAANNFPLFVNNVTFLLHFLGIKMNTNWMSNITNCAFNSAVAGTTDILINNTINDDQGDNTIGPGNEFLSFNINIHQQAGGGTRIVGNKFLGGTVSSVLVDYAGVVGTSDLFIQGNSFEGASASGQILLAPSGAYGNILITGNEMAGFGIENIVVAPTGAGVASFGNITGNVLSGTVCIDFNPAGAGGANAWYINGNTFNPFYMTIAAIRLPAVPANLTNLSVGLNQHIPGGVPYVLGTFDATSGFGPGIFTKAGFNTVLPTREVDIAGTIRSRGIAAPAVSEANSGTIYFDSGLNKYRVSLNSGAYVDLVGSAGLTGTGVAGRLPFWTAATDLSDAVSLYVDAVNNRLGLNVPVPLYRIDCDGDVNLSTGSVIRTNAIEVFKTDVPNSVTLVGGGQTATPAVNSTAVGRNALLAATNLSVASTALGASALTALTNGLHNTGIGTGALSATTTGSDNTSVGRNAGATNTTGSQNVLLGEAADVTAGNLTNAVAIGYQASVGANDSMSLGNASMKVGIHTTTPAAPLDVDGAVATRHKDIALINGVNSDVVLTDTSWVRITGPSALFSIGGFTGGTDGRHLTIYNTTAFAMSILNADAGSGATNQITTPSGGTQGCKMATFIYEDTTDKWILVNFS